MSDAEQVSDGQNSGQSSNPVQMRIERLYLKDVSFESPGAPNNFAEQPWQPKTHVDINTTVNNLGDGRHEVVLTATIKSTRDQERVAYVVEVQYAGIFVIEGATGGQLQQVLGIACPNALFPYVRENLDNLVVRGGFAPLQLAPVNFEMLFAQAIQQAREQDAGKTH